jgi:hypothetical protein
VPAIFQPRRQPAAATNEDYTVLMVIKLSHLEIIFKSCSDGAYFGCGLLARNFCSGAQSELNYACVLGREATQVNTLTRPDNTANYFKLFLLK